MGGQHSAGVDAVSCQSLYDSFELGAPFNGSDFGTLGRFIGPGEDLPQDIPCDIRESEIASGVAIGEPLLIQPHEVQDHGSMRLCALAWCQSVIVSWRRDEVGMICVSMPLLSHL